MSWIQIFSLGNVEFQLLRSFHCQTKVCMSSHLQIQKLTECLCHSSTSDTLRHEVRTSWGNTCNGVLYHWYACDTEALSASSGVEMSWFLVSLWVFLESPCTGSDDVMLCDPSFPSSGHEEDNSAYFVSEKVVLRSHKGKTTNWCAAHSIRILATCFFSKQFGSTARSCHRSNLAPTMQHPEDR